MKYTKETLNARMAEVMGWELHPYLKGIKVYITKDHKHTRFAEIEDWVDDCGIFTQWQPTEDANQALMVLERQCASFTIDFNYNEDGGYWAYHVDSIYDAYNKSLPLAICMAIASAVDKEKAKLAEAKAKEQGK